MRLSKASKIATSIVACTVVLVIGVLTLRRIRGPRPESKTISTGTIEPNADVPGDWLRLEIQEQVTFHIPAYLKSGSADRADGYRRFRSGGIEIQMDYGLTNHVTVCVLQSDQMRASAIKVETTKIDGREAKIERVDKIPFNLDDDEKLAVKGFLICVPNVGDNTHEFSVVGKYQSTEDYQTLLRIVDSIRFVNRRN